MSNKENLNSKKSKRKQKKEWSSWKLRKEEMLSISVNKKLKRKNIEKKFVKQWNKMNAVVSLKSNNNVSKKTLKLGKLVKQGNTNLYFKKKE